ncbi:MAG: hypothetical protein BWX45_01182 [Deltaproteobacteria bacterium ADurb.Bin002]|nr:MAG: hypothetical protein BWX45_01182 [Deltaproteobacteria bacterium ADurb.Bin002]
MLLTSPVSSLISRTHTAFSLRDVFPVSSHASMPSTALMCLTYRSSFPWLLTLFMCRTSGLFSPSNWAKAQASLWIARSDRQSVTISSPNSPMSSEKYLAPQYPLSSTSTSIMSFGGQTWARRSLRASSSSSRSSMLIGPTASATIRGRLGDRLKMYTTL